jgi:hypothetical protein
MKPNANPHEQLPQPEPGNTDNEAVLERSAPTSLPTPEKEARAMEQPGSSVPTQPPALPPPVDPQLVVASTDEPAVSTGNSDDKNPVVADDVDLIEKAWVTRAKAIVDEYKHDPYMQEKEVGKLQADYLHKRYGKTMKSDA